MKIIKTTISILVSLIIVLLVVTAVYDLATFEPAETVYSASSCLIRATC